MKKAFRFLFVLISAVLFFVWVWFVFIKLKNDPVVEVEELISKKKWHKALRRIESLIEKDTSTMMHFYVLGSVTTFGLEESSPAIIENKINDYDYQLIRRDATGLFLRESILHKLRIFPNSERAMGLVCEYIDYFPNTALTEEPLKEVLEKIILNDTRWKLVDQACFDQIFNMDWEFMERNKAQIVRSYTLVKNNPHWLSETKYVFKKDTHIVIRKKGHPEIKNSAKWSLAVNDKQMHGWIFNKHFE